MKITLINPPLQKDFPSDSCSPPLGLIAIAAPVQQAGIEVKIIDAAAKGLLAEQIAAEVAAEKPDLVGITSMTAVFPEALKAASAIKEKDKDIKICCGGAHATLMAEDVLHSGFFDFVVRGEGEEAFLESCEALRKGTGVESIKGVSFRKNGKVVHNEDRKYIKEMDRLVFPSYELLPFRDYQPKAPPGFVRKLPWLTYCSSRSCPFGCRFCATSKIWGKMWRGFSADRMIEDVKRLINTYGLKTVFFVDDNFTFKRERILEFCRKIKEQGLKFEWTCNCRVDQVDEELLRTMKEAGCWRIGFGIEGGTQKVLDWYGKGTTLDQARNAIKLCKKVGITQACYFIIGAPIENEEDIKTTIRFAKELDSDVVGFSYITPFPGTRLYDEYIEHNWAIGESVVVQHTGYNTIDFSKFNQNRPMVKCGVSQKRLMELSKMAYKEFYFRPKYMIRQAVQSIRNPRRLQRGMKSILGWLR